MRAENLDYVSKSVCENSKELAEESRSLQDVATISMLVWKGHFKMCDWRFQAGAIKWTMFCCSSPLLNWNVIKKNCAFESFERKTFSWHLHFLGFPSLKLGQETRTQEPVGISKALIPLNINIALPYAPPIYGIGWGVTGCAIIRT